MRPLPKGFVVRLAWGALALASIAGTARAQCSATPSDIEGPYHRAGSPYRTNFRRTGDVTNLLVLTGRVLDASCRPVPHAWIDFWHADAAGIYENSSAEYRYRGF